MTIHDMPAQHSKIAFKRSMELRLGNAAFVKIFSYHLFVVFVIVAFHAIAIFAFTQKRGTLRPHQEESSSTRKITRIRLLANTPLTQRKPDTTVPLITLAKPLHERIPEPEYEPEKSNSLLGQDEPENAGFIPTSQLTEKPLVQLDIDPDISLSLASNINRVAILRLRIDELGEITQVFFEQGDFSQTEIEFLISACKAMKFSPGKLNQTSVKSEMRIEMIIEALNVAPIMRQ